MVSFILQKLAHSVSWANSVRSRGWNFCRNSGLVSFINSGAAEIPSARLTGPFGYARLRENHPGELVAKVGYFGVKSAKVCRAQMGTKPAKVGRLGPRCAKVRRGPHPAPTGASAKRSSIHAASKVAKVGAAGGPKLLKWGRLRARQGQIC